MGLYSEMPIRTKSLEPGKLQKNVVWSTYIHVLTDSTRETKTIITARGSFQG